MVDTNEITGSRLTTKPPTKEYEDGWDRIFGKKVDTKEVKEAQCAHWVVGWENKGKINND